MRQPVKRTLHIKDQAAFEACLAALARAPEPLLALDTEFERRSTFYPKAGLVQLADEETCYLIDPLTVSDWRPFTEMLRSPAARFIVHSASEDLNLLLCALDCLPRNLIDTQIAAALLDKNYALSYQALVEKLLGVKLEKGETRSDWLRRPLRERQLRYAALDVMYLHGLWQDLAAALREKGRLAWLEEECQRLLESAAAVESPRRWQEMYTEVGGASRLSKAELESLRRLCLWRETTARKRNRPRLWIARDDELTELARYHHRQRPRTPIDKRDCPGINKGLLRDYNKTLQALLEAADAAGEPADPGLLKRDLPRDLSPALQACRQAVAARAEALRIAPGLLGGRRLLERLLQDTRRRGLTAWPGAFSGWREEALAADLMPILREIKPD